MPVLQGRWRKTIESDDFAQYPHEIIFAEDTYRTAKSPDQSIIWWDAGIYRVKDVSTLMLSTATDEMVEYGMQVRGKQLMIDIPDRGTIHYERVEETEQR